MKATKHKPTKPGNAEAPPPRADDAAGLTAGNLKMRVEELGAEAEQLADFLQAAVDSMRAHEHEDSYGDMIPAEMVVTTVQDRLRDLQRDADQVGAEVYGYMAGKTVSP